MKYLLLILLATSCAVSKDYRLKACLVKDFNTCHTGVWPFTKDECMDQVKRAVKKYRDAIWYCKKVEQ
jgi:hypothetical protein